MSADKPMRVYIGTYTGAKSKGIYLCRFDPLTGKLGLPELAAETKSPSFLAVHPSRRFLYAVGEGSTFGGTKAGVVSAFSFESGTGKLTLLNQQSSGGGGPCHLAVDRSGKWVLAANYGSGSVAALPIEADGKLSAPNVSIQHQGSSVNPQRQAGPHAHFITADPANRFALACDLGLDKVLVYRLDPVLHDVGDERALRPQTGRMPVLRANEPPGVSVKAGSGPRHLAFHPDGRHIYLINELAWTLTVFSYDHRRGVLEELQTISTVPENFTGDNLAAEVQVHPSGKFVFGSNRGHDSIVVFAVDPKSGRLSYVEHQPTGGKTPRHFALDPSGKWLLAENQDSDSIVVFAVDPKTGRLNPTGQSVEVGAPVCVVFVPD